MTTRIGIGAQTFDTRAAARAKKFYHIGYKQITDLSILDVYTIDKDFTPKQLEDIGSKLANPLTQKFGILSNRHSGKRSASRISQNLEDNVRDSGQARMTNTFSFAIEIGFLPGVTDNVAHTTKEIIEDGLNVTFENGEGVYTSQVTFLEGKLTAEDANKIALELHNPLIQRSHIKSYAEFVKDDGMDVIVPKVTLAHKPNVSEINLNVSDEELVIIGKQGIANPDGTRRGPMALDLTYMKTIQTYFKKLGRNPTDIELESLGQTWSEHCKHTIFADPMDEITDGLFKTYIKKATVDIRKKKGKKDFCVSVFTDNSGSIAFDEEFMISHKVETHNSPSALDPFGGSITGIVGVNRDTIGFGMGAKPIANFYGFCFADPRVDIPLYRDQKLTNKMLSSSRIMDGVIDGVNAGGNQSGIPTPSGFVYFDERYRGKPLVIVGTVGIMPRKIKGKLAHEKKAEPGDLIVMVGGRVGKDGVHGVTFASEALDSGSPAAAVQIGDPITQKKLSDAIVKETRDLLLYNSITDIGGGGLSCSVAEMARESGGAKVKLESIPLKYPGLDPWEVWISESQERMTIAIPKKNWKKFSDLMTSRGVEATVIGEFTKSGKCIVTFNGKTIMDVGMEFLHNGLPQRAMTTSYVKPLFAETEIPQDKNLSATLTEILSRLNITSFEFISRQYDHIVQGNAVLGPLQGRGRVNADAAVIRPILSSNKGAVLSQALYPTYSEIDPYNMAASSIDSAIRNAVAAGADPENIALLDNFCWCSSNDPARLGQLKLAVKACYDYAVAYGTPYISGKDSMFNDFKGFDKNGKPISISIPPTLLISSIGVIPDITKVVSLDAKIPGDLVYILGDTYEELAGSEYFGMKNAVANAVPKVDPRKNKTLYNAFHNAVQKNLVASSISVNRGGLAVALAKKAIGGMLGLTVSLQNLPGEITRDDFALYSESQGRLLVTIAKENKTAFEKALSGNTFMQIGTVTKDPTLLVKGLQGNEIINLNIKNATDSYRKTFKDY